MPQYRVTDTITIERTWNVSAESEDAAIALVSNGDIDPDYQEEADNTPYEAKEVFANTPDKCPSKHWNRGDDICADCGESLNGS